MLWPPAFTSIQEMGLRSLWDITPMDVSTFCLSDVTVFIQIKRMQIKQFEWACVELDPPIILEIEFLALD